MSKRIGDAPVEQRFADMMKKIALFLDDLFNPGLAETNKNTGFILLVFPFEGHEGRCNYISNAEREDVIVLLKEQLRRFEGQPELQGRA